MTLDEAFVALGAPDDVTPIEGMEVLLGAWDEAAPRCRAMLRAFVGGEDLSSATERALFPIMHLLGERADSAAFDDLCALAGDPDRSDLIFGETIGPLLPCLLLSCFGGDPAPLWGLAGRRAADPLARDGALMALAYLTLTRRLARADMHAGLLALLDTLTPDDDGVVWLGWIQAVALMGFGALAGRVRDVFQRGLVPHDTMRLADFQADLRRSQDRAEALDMLAELGVGPVGGAVATLRSWNAEAAPAASVPYVNPLRQVGRNSPCPCGSGKKFKACCMTR